MRATAVAWNSLESALELPAGSEVTYCDAGEWEHDDRRAARVVRVVALLPDGQIAHIRVMAELYERASDAPEDVRLLTGRGWRHG